MHQLVIQVVLDTFGNIAIEPMSFVGSKGIFQRDGEGSTRNGRPIGFGRWLSRVVDGIVDKGSARSDDLNV